MPSPVRGAFPSVNSFYVSLVRTQRCGEFGSNSSSDFYYGRISCLRARKSVCTSSTGATPTTRRRPPLAQHTPTQDARRPQVPCVSFLNQRTSLDFFARGIFSPFPCSHRTTTYNKRTTTQCRMMRKHTHALATRNTCARGIA